MMDRTRKIVLQISTWIPALSDRFCRPSSLQKQEQIADKLYRMLDCLFFKSRIIHGCTVVGFVRNCSNDDTRNLIQICCVCDCCTLHLRAFRLKQLHKLVNVIKVSSKQDDSSNIVSREILFVKVQAIGHTQREEIKTLCDIFKAQIVDITPELYILQYVDTSFEVDRFLKAVKEQAEVVETVRSGVCGIFRGEQSLHS